MLSSLGAVALLAAASATVDPRAFQKGTDREPEPQRAPTQGPPTRQQRRKAERQARKAERRGRK